MIKSKTWFLFISLILLIVLRFFTSRPAYKNGDNVRITANILSDPIKYSTSQALKLAGLKIYLPTFPEVSYGDRIVVEGTVNNGELDNPKLIKILDEKTLLSGFRNRVVAFYQQVLPSREAGLIGGVVLGSKNALPQDFYKETKKIGVAHIVVASGTNVTFVVSFLMGITTLFLPRRKAIAFVILGIILYLFISGFDAPLIRAAIMATFAFIAQETGRLKSAWRVLLLTASLMLIYNPDWLTDIGFILSFASTASILIFQKKFELWLKRLPEILKQDFSITLAAQIGVSPILFITFGQFNLLSPLANLLVLWTVPGIMILGVAGGVMGLLMPELGKLILYLCYPLLWWFVSIVTLFNS
jgi:competence protein ComEC